MGTLEAAAAEQAKGVPRVDDRGAIIGIVHVLQSGCRWTDTPAVYGPRKTLDNRDVRWAAKGACRLVVEALVAAGGPPTEVLIDSTHVKAHRSAAGGKGGLTRRRSAPAATAGTRRFTASPTDTAGRSPST